MRIEKDSLGEVKLSDDVYYGINTYRASENFPVSGRKTDELFIIGFAQVKLAAAETNLSLGYLDKDKGSAIISAVKEIIEGEFHEQIIVDPLQGGAGTSLNMNFNEVIANRALEIMGRKKGEYEIIHPLNHVNMHQSTNDVFPTALRIAVLNYLKKLEFEISKLQEEFQKKEIEFRDIIKLGRTELQDAVPITLGMEFGAYAEAFSRDRWRIFKCRERIKVVNLGGTAVGTGLGAARDYIFKVTENIRNITGLNLARGENLVDATQNLDSFVEISGMLKTYAVNLIKISNDLRLLSSGPNGGLSEIKLPPVQAGSTIMPAKVNPVILEAAVQVGLKIISNDQMITSISSMGNLELNQLFPLLADAILETLKLLNNITKILREKCIKGIKPNIENCKKNIDNSKSIAAILVPLLGYKKVEEIIFESEKRGKSINEILKTKGILNDREISDILNPKKMYKLGYSDEDKIK
jgi:aspartate ammonia-lyase